jgi:myo-inositol catabolism protein IolS
MSNKMWMGTELYNGSFGNSYSQKDLESILSYAEEIGVDKIDTAECYNMEEMIGKSLLGKKNRFKIATKFGHQFHRKNKINNFSLVSIKEQLELSLKNLNIEQIELYYFHSGSNIEFNNDDLWEYLLGMQAKGAIKNLGLSIQHDLVIKQDNFQINLVKKYGINVVQTVLNKFSQHSLQYVIPFCKKNKVKVFGRMPLAKGLLTGKYKSDHIFNENDQRSRSSSLNRDIINNNHSENYFSSLKWCTSHVDEVVIGSKNKEQLLQNYQTINHQ